MSVGFILCARHKPFGGIAVCLRSVVFVTTNCPWWHSPHLRRNLCESLVCGMLAVELFWQQLCWTGETEQTYPDPLGLGFLGNQGCMLKYTWPSKTLPRDISIEDSGTTCRFVVFIFSLSEVVMAQDNSNSSEAWSLGQTQSLTRKGPQPSHWIFILRFMDTLVYGLRAMRLCIFCECSWDKTKDEWHVILCMEPNHSVYAALNVSSIRAIG